MNKRRNKNDKAKSRRDKAGFYIAFSLCLAAVGLSVWSAYSGVTGYFKDNSPSETEIHEQESTEKVDKNLVDITEETETDAPENTEDAVEYVESDETSETQENYEGVNQEEPETSQTSESSLEETAEQETTDEEEDISQEDIVETILRVNKNLGFPTESKVIGKMFSENMVYDSTMRDYRAHLGTDFPCESGEKIISMCDGTVEDIYTNEMMGTVVKVSSGEFSILYCGLSEDVSVSSGDQVSKEQELGTAFGVPCEAGDGCHIHVEIIVRNRYIDPLTVIENES